MKVAYNKCFDGFNISKACVKWVGNRDNTQNTAIWESGREDGEVHGDLSDTPRHDAFLVMVIEELGKKANGTSSDLTLHVLTGDRYKIEKYDGYESAVEPKDIEWVKV